MLFILISLCIYLFFCAKIKNIIPSYFSIEKTNVLKAILPFGIIVHHISFNFPQNILLNDFHFTGPYIVGIFFFISGYALEFQYYKNKINLNGLVKRIKKLLIPLVLPSTLYLILIICIEKQTIVEILKLNFNNGQIFLPHTWFITILIAMYILYYTSRHLFKNNHTYLLFLSFIFTLFFILIKKTGNSHIYSSNYAFIIGIAFKQNEKKIINWASKWSFYLTCLILLGSISICYLDNKPIFKGFTIIGVPLYAFAFILLTTRMPQTKSNKIITFFNGISYEMYLFQSISILLINNLHTTSTLIYVIFILILNIILSFIANKATYKFL